MPLRTPGISKLLRDCGRDKSRSECHTLRLFHQNSRVKRTRQSASRGSRSFRTTATGAAFGDSRSLSRLVASGLLVKPPPMLGGRDLHWTESPSLGSIHGDFSLPPMNGSSLKNTNSFEVAKFRPSPDLVARQWFCEGPGAVAAPKSASNNPSLCDRRH